jgi:hypothetical protein
LRKSICFSNAKKKKTLLLTGSFGSSLPRYDLFYHPFLVNRYSRKPSFQEVVPQDAPVVIWLQGGPGGSSMFGLLELHGPIQVTEDPSLSGKINPYSWTKQANMLYIDNPVGAGNISVRIFVKNIT